MKGNAWAYYADFVVYPAILAALTIYSLGLHPGLHVAAWLAALVAGAAGWTLVEYVIHRFVLHHLPYFRDLHDKHHAEPTSLVETPLWMSLFVITFGVFGPAYFLLGFDIASGFTIGMTAGFLAYGTMHHAMHHWQIRHGTYLYRAKRRHAQHHYTHDEGNFGVITPFWDHVFGTAVPVRERKTAA